MLGKTTKINGFKCLKKVLYIKYFRHGVSMNNDLMNGENEFAFSFDDSFYRDLIEEQAKEEASEIRKKLNIKENENALIKQRRI